MPKKEKVFTMPVIALILLSFALGTSEFIIVGILPDISEGLSVSLTTAGSLVSMFAFVYAVGTPFTAALAGRFHRFALIISLTVVFVVGNFLCAIAPNYPLLAAARILLSIVSGTLISVSMTFVPDISSLEHRATVVSWVFAGFSLASIFGVPIGTTISHVLRAGGQLLLASPCAAFWCWHSCSFLCPENMKKCLPASCSSLSC